MRTLILLLCLLQAVSGPALAACGMPRVAVHVDPDRTPIHASTDGIPSLYYRANMDVNTDGSGRSYHPMDPYGKKLAFNNIGNAIKRIYDAAGNDVTCTPKKNACFTRIIDTFIAARNAKYDPVGHPRIETGHMIPWRMDAKLGRMVPCTIGSGVFKGYFVSPTSIAVDAKRSNCDQGRYLDSFTFNAVVLPEYVDWRSQGTPTDDGDVVVVRDVGTGRIAYAINGDRGPAKGIGEGTIRLTAALKQVKLKGDEPYAKIKALAVKDVQYVVFPRNDIRREVGKTYTQADIDRVGAELFEKWGGRARLDDCLNP